MTPRPKFPAGSVRQAVAAFGDDWGYAFEHPSGEKVNEVFRAERRDVDVMRRCEYTANRGTEFDPRAWIGVPPLERRI